MSKEILYALVEHKGIVYKACIVESDAFYRLNSKKGVILANSKECKIIKSKVVGKTNF